jgi:DnaJ-class molecular chaperone
MSLRLTNFRWYIPYHRLANTSRAFFIHPRYFSSSQRLRRADHYAVLGVSKDASAAEIQQAFLKQSMKKHPDVNKSPNAHTEFQASLAAKEALIDSLWAKEDADRMAAEELRKQQEEEVEREKRRIAKQRHQQEREKRGRARPKAASQASKLKQAAERELQAAKDREHARWEEKLQKESKLEYEVRVKEAREDQIATQNFRKKIKITAYVLFGIGAVAFLSDVFWGTVSVAEDRTSQEGSG